MCYRWALAELLFAVSVNNNTHNQNWSPVFYTTPFCQNRTWLKIIFMELNEFQQAFGERVFTARKAKGLSKKQLAKSTKLQTTDITQMEEGKRNATLDVIRRLSIALGVTPDYFFTWK